LNVVKISKKFIGGKYMKRNLKRIASIIMTVAMISTVMVGCGNSSSPTSGGAASAKTKLTLWHIQTSTAADAIKASAKRFMEKNPQYDVEVVDQVNDSYKQKLSMAMSSNQTPDVFIQW